METLTVFKLGFFGTCMNKASEINCLKNRKLGIGSKTINIHK